MSTTDNKAEHIGRRLGRAWRVLERQDARVVRWVADRGVPRRVAASLMWIVKLCVIAALLYAAFSVVLVIAVILIVVARAQHVDQDPDQPKWLEKDPTIIEKIFSTTHCRTTTIRILAFTIPDTRISSRSDVCSVAGDYSLA